MPSITGDKTLEGTRALTEEELDWLDKFYSEYNGASFKGDGTDLHVNDEERQAYIDSIKLRIKDYRVRAKTSKMTKEDWQEFNDLKDELREVDLKKNCYDRNNERNRCLYNNLKMTGSLKRRTMGELDQNTIEKFGYADMELAVALNTDLLDDD